MDAPLQMKVESLLRDSLIHKKEIKKQTCKPGSVSRLNVQAVSREFYHLSAMTVTSHLDQPTHPDDPPERIRSEQPRNPDIFGLSTHKVYPLSMSPLAGVGSYPPFSPLSHECDGFFLWHLLFLPPCGKKTFPLGSVALCVARTFLPG